MFVMFTQLMTSSCYVSIFAKLQTLTRTPDFLFTRCTSQSLLDLFMVEMTGKLKQEAIDAQFTSSVCKLTADVCWVGAPLPAVLAPSSAVSVIVQFRCATSDLILFSITSSTE